MPPGIEMTIVRYHFKILFGDIRKYFTTRHWWIYIREVMRGKDTNRILTNIALMDKSCMGSLLDIGGGKKRASHFRFLRMSKWHKITTVDISQNAEPDFVLNIENEKLPFKDESFDYVFLMNVLEHLNNRKEVLSEIRRVLKNTRIDAAVDATNDRGSNSGQLVGVIPFLVNVHPDPHDFVRLTEQGLQNLFVDCGFGSATIQPVGCGPFTAGYYQFEFVIPRILRLIIGPVFMVLDKIVSLIFGREFKNKFPLSYIFYVSK
jgi:SAM-dependent methyltransferase